MDLVKLKENCINDCVALNIIYEQALDSFTLCKEMHIVKDKKKKEFIDNSDYILKIRSSLWTQSVIELFKFTSNGKNDYYSIYNHILRFRKGNKYDALKIDSLFVNSWQSEIDSYLYIYAKIKLLRNELYAHYSKSFSPEFFEAKLTYQELETILRSFSYVIRTTYSLLTGGDLILENKFEGKGLKLIDDLYNANQNFKN